MPSAFSRPLVVPSALAGPGAGYLVVRHTKEASRQMKKILLLATVAIPLASNSAWTDGTGKPIPDTPSMRSSGDFGAQLILTGSEKEFRSTWNSTAGTPKLQSTNTVKRGQTISGVIVFSGCAAGQSHVCKVTADFSLRSPDGTKTAAGSGSIWSKAPLAPRIIMLGDASVTIGFNDADALGPYTLIANVTDQIAKQSVQLSIPFTVTK